MTVEAKERLTPLHKGITALDITTSGFYQNPEEAWAVADRVNRDERLEGDKKVKVEVYSTLTRPGFTQLRKLAKAARIPIAKDIPVAPNVTAEKIWDWKNQYPSVDVVRVHPAFSYNVYELWHRMFIGERENGLRYQMFQTAWILDFGAATNMKGVKLTEELRAQGNETIMNMHTNVIEGFARDGRLGEVQKRVGKILAENERNYKDPYIKDRRLIYDPQAIVSEIVERRPEVEGLLLGTDHGYEHGIDMAALLSDPKIRQYTQAIHLADTTHQTAHDTIQIGDPKFAHFLTTAANTWFAHPVRAALDYNPIVLGKRDFEGKVELVKETRRWIMGIQESGHHIDPPSLRISHQTPRREHRAHRHPVSSLANS